MYSQVAGAVFGVEALSSRYFCPRGVGFPRLGAFCWGTRKMKESRHSFSWCPGGELGAGVVGLRFRTGCGLSDL